MLPPYLEPEEAALAEDKEKVEKPSLYRVLLHNDDYTSMEFVVFVLRSIFHKNFEDAYRLMMDVHMKGKGVAGVFTFEIAEMKVSQTMDLARENDFPLLCTMEATD